MSQGDVSIVGETLEDMSLSSTSLSLDRNDTSQEYMDDFDNLGKNGTENVEVFFFRSKFGPDAPFPSFLVFPGSGEARILLPSSKNDEDDSGLDQSCTRFDDEKVAVGGVTKAARFCFLDDGMEWAGTEGQEQRLTQRRRRSSQPEYNEQVLIDEASDLQEVKGLLVVAAHQLALARPSLPFSPHVVSVALSSVGRLVPGPVPLGQLWVWRHLHVG